MSMNSLTIKSRLVTPTLPGLSRDRLKSLMKRGEDAAKNLGARAAGVLFAFLAAAAILTFVGTVVASLVWRRHKSLRHRAAAL